MIARRLVQSSVAPLALLLAACVGGGLAPSVWPPPDFELTVEESRLDGRSMHVIRRLHVDATGVVFYGTSSEPLVDDVTGTSLPVFRRLSLYRLEPTSLRALARRLDRLGIGELAETPPPSTAGENGDTGLTLRWRAFGDSRVLTSEGRVRGPLTEILAVVAAHLPAGERFDTRIGRPIVPVLQGVPEPAESTEGALAACRELLAERGDEPALLLDAFALACVVGRRDVAADLLERWRRQRALRQSGMGDEAGAPRLGAGLLTRLLPPAE